jgi:eukaryotic-like serine/threonine-protein kinase
VAATAEGLLKNRYALREPLGQGGMAVVYRAFDTALGREVAIKLFSASSDDIEGARQEDEVHGRASLSHHSLVTLLDAGVDRSDRDNPRVFLVMELVHGPDLQRALRAGPLTSRQISQIGYDLAEGLSYIHRRGIVHRDIKPSNVLLADYQDDNSRARAMLTDFGIAHRGVQQQAEGSTTTGTAAYLSPEQVRREPVGAPSDVYSLGLVLLECFTGTLAYPGEPVDSAMSRLIIDPAMPEALGTQWRQLLSAMTARDPRRRPLSNELVLALRDLVILETGRHRVAEAPAIPVNQAERVELTGSHGGMDSAVEGAFDRIASLSARVLGTPIALVSIVDADRIWFSSHYGLDLEQIEREMGPLASAVYNGKPWIIDGARVDPRALSTPAVAGELGLQFYAGVPLTSHDGYTLGTLCVLDVEPRAITEAEVMTLIDLGAMVMSELELRLSHLRQNSTSRSSV